MNDEKNRSGHSEWYPCAHHGANADAKIGWLPGCDLRVAGRNRRVVQNASTGCAFNGGQGVFAMDVQRTNGNPWQGKTEHGKLPCHSLCGWRYRRWVDRKGTAGKARGSDRRFSLRFGIRKLLCFGDRQCLNQTTTKRNMALCTDKKRIDKFSK